MSRTIKFRVWDIDNNEFVYISETTDGEIWINNGISTVTMPEHKGSYEQYTGLKDKNGKEIYEGDVVKCWDDENGKVYFCDISLQYRVMFTNGDDEDLASCEPEVIGNIHENGDLLNDTED